MAFFASITAMVAANDGISRLTMPKMKLLRVQQIEGVCIKLRSGIIVRVVFWVGNCAGYGTADAYTGWNSVFRIYVEEVLPPQV